MLRTILAIILFAATHPAMAYSYTLEITYYMIFFMGGPQLGELEAGLVAALFSAPVSVITGGLGCLIAAAVTAWKAPMLPAQV